ncbi:MAG: hypothetical protein A2Y98_01295 [Candidatus Portnoybacteria bacterium RBG_19FT_COMBO_36_7]|uniref:CYTH domain-containing protein n=1 Tax=Candidatus Portnoybacteria bacterium RBG_19FT_COMBO_36_7 TaxID=1801992 RepID=A0A1G2F6Z4_9BACT|nr:MAG: hypothetical protein A2Y98_01295 [Candidatus Portnoybacteria bacterium RBG_19FT_COMBO_36_7]
MKNIELKVKINSIRGIAGLLKKLHAKHRGVLKQIDTYYNDKEGRLKIREVNGKYFEKIFYKRPDKESSKISFYTVSKIKKPQLQKEKSFLKKALGEKVIVEKQRELWILKNTRVHLDRVKHLGNFLELETEVEKAGKNAEREHKEIIDQLNLSKYKPFAKSYSDMLMN